MNDTGAWVEFNQTNWVNILNEIRNTVLIQTAVILKLQNDLQNLNCNCNVIHQQVKSITSGQAILDITQITPVKFPLIRRREPLLREVIKDEPNKELEKSPKSVYRVDDGYFSIVGTGTGWKIDGNKIVNKSGYDLEKSLPIRLDKDRSIIGYVVKMTSQGIQPILIYKCIDYFGEDRILEGGPNFYRKFFK